MTPRPLNVSLPPKNTVSARKRYRYRARQILLALCLILPTVSALGQSSDVAAEPFIMTADGEPTTYASRWVTLIYNEVFKRLGIPYRIEHYTLARRAALVEDGSADGEVSRVFSYGDSHPNLVRVDESLISFGFSLYSANSAVSLERLEDLRGTNYLVEYRRGILICENTVKKFVPDERISDVPTQQQGLKKLVAGRTDLYCDIDVYVRQELAAPAFKDAPKVRKVISLGEAVPTYPYLNKKHAALAPRMAAVLKQMKAEGLIETYRLQVERELGWTR